MRPILALTLVAAVGCGSSNNNNTQNDGAVSPDLATTPKDMAGGSATCDVGAQTGCPSGMKCVPMVAGANQDMLVGTCVADGTVAESAACDFVSMGQNDPVLNDTCKGGLFCDTDGGDNSKACRKICKADSDCTKSGEKCMILFNGVSWGACIPTCTPGAPDPCGTGHDCSASLDDISSTQNTENGYFVCKTTGTGAVFDACQSDADCGAGLWCDIFTNNWCVPNCDSTHACPQPPMDGGQNAGTTVTCNPLANLPNGAGYCL